MRYLGQFPSEAQVRDAILPQVNRIIFEREIKFYLYIIIKIKIEEDEPSEFIKYQKFEPYMLKGDFINVTTCHLFFLYCILTLK